MPLVFTQPDPAPEKPKSWLRKTFTANHVFRALWALLGTFDIFNGVLGAIGGHPFGASVDITVGVYMWLIAWDTKRTTGWVRTGVIHMVRGILFTWRLCAPVAARAVTVPYTRLSDRYGFYGKTLRMRARLRRMRNKIRRNR